jgi:cell division protein FtsB
MYNLFRKHIAYVGSFLAVGTMVGFFGFHTIAGDRGILARPELERKIQLAEEQLTLLNKHHAFLEHRISLMQDESIDADMLEETAQSELGLYSPNDVIISIDLSDLKY